MPEREARVISREVKLAALSRMLGGENVSALARELGFRRKLLYKWRGQFRSGGPEALRTRGRPTKAEALAIQAHGGAGSLSDDAVPIVAPPPDDALSKAQRRIADLERKIGRQQVELDFFQRALRQVGEARRTSGAAGATASTRSSKR